MAEQPTVDELPFIATDTMRANGNQEVAEEIAGLNHKHRWDSAVSEDAMIRSQERDRFAALELRERELALKQQELSISQAQFNLAREKDQHSVNQQMGLTNALAHSQAAVSGNMQAHSTAQYQAALNSGTLAHEAAMRLATVNSLNGTQLMGARIAEPNDTALASTDSANASMASHNAAGAGAVQTALGISDLTAARQVADVNIINNLNQTNASIASVLSQMQVLSNQVATMQGIIAQGGGREPKG